MDLIGSKMNAKKKWGNCSLFGPGGACGISGDSVARDTHFHNCKDLSAPSKRFHSSYGYGDLSSESLKKKLGRLQPLCDRNPGYYLGQKGGVGYRLAEFSIVF